MAGRLRKKLFLLLPLHKVYFGGNDRNNPHYVFCIYILSPIDNINKNLFYYIFRDGLIYFPDFCKIILRKFREENISSFGSIMFKVGILNFAFFAMHCNQDYIDYIILIATKKETFFYTCY